MKLFSILLVCLTVSTATYCQSETKLGAVQSDSAYTNILVKKLYTDVHSTSFIIWIKESVRAHKHDLHTENIYVLDGKGLLTLGETTKMIKKGDYIVIPQGVVHALKVTSGKAMKVLSIQSPEFFGKDRIFVE